MGGCFCVRENIQYGVGCAPVGHPVFSINQQGLADPGKDFLDGLDQFYAKDGRRRHHDNGVVVQQLILQF